MKCPFCGCENIAGSDDCEACGEDLTAFDGVRLTTRLEKSLAKDAIDSLRTSAPARVGLDTPLREVADHLAVENRNVLVMDGAELVGIVTERDLLFKAMGAGPEWEKMTASQVMTAKPECLQGTDKIAYALHKMALGGFRHIPVLHAGQPERVVSVRDVLEYLAEMFPDAVGIHE